MLHIAVMVSGKGQLLQHFYDKIETGSLFAEISAVICSRHCPAEHLARYHESKIYVVPGSLDKETLETAMKNLGVDTIALTGYLKKFNVPDSYRDRCLSIHPSLLPKFGGNGMYGLKVHQAVLDAGEKETGCTVHLVDNEYDHGELILQKRCLVLPTDNTETLSRRVLELEKETYIEALRQIDLQV